MSEDKKQPHWTNGQMVGAWMDNQDHKDWASFSSAMLKHSTCPPDYDDGLLRRQVGLLRYQFARAGYDAPSAPEMPTKRSKKPKAQSIAEHYGLTPNPNAIDAYKKD